MKKNYLWKIILPLIFSIAVLGLIGFSQEADAASVTITDQTSCETIPGAVWSTSPDTCTVTTDQTIANGETWTVNPGVRLLLNTYYVDITVDNGGTIKNFGLLRNLGTINNSGTIDNPGTIDNGMVGTINNEDTINNSGSIDNGYGGASFS